VFKGLSKATSLTRHMNETLPVLYGPNSSIRTMFLYRRIMFL